MSNITLWATMQELVEAAVRHFGIPEGTVLEPLRRGKHDGKAWRPTLRRPARIRIRVHKYRRPKVPLAASAILATLAHEIAHLIPGGWDHGPEHRRLAREVAAWMRGRGHQVSTRLFK